MKKGNINISVSGGAADFGNVVQGDDNKISSVSERALEDFHCSLASLQKQNVVNSDQIEKLKNEIDSIIKDRHDLDLMDKAKLMYERYSWAIAPLQKLFKVILP